MSDFVKVDTYLLVGFVFFFNCQRVERAQGTGERASQTMFIGIQISITHTIVEWFICLLCQKTPTVLAYVTMQRLYSYQRHNYVCFFFVFCLIIKLDCRPDQSFCRPVVHFPSVSGFILPRSLQGIRP